MSQIDYSTMSDAELKSYSLKRREDKEALRAYLDRLNQRPFKVIAHPDDPDFDEKVRVAILRKLEAAKNKNSQTTEQ